MVMVMATMVMVNRRGEGRSGEQQNKGEQQKLFHNGYPDTGIYHELCGNWMRIKPETKDRESPDDFKGHSAGPPPGAIGRQ
jgi:hypothetical protein